MAYTEGLEDYIKKLEKLEAKTGKKAMRQSASAALTKTYREIKAAAPVGKKPHRTYKGRLVSPGFLKRSIKKRSRVVRGRPRVQASIKVDREAFYGVVFLDRGVPSRGIKARRWFADKFYRNRKQIEDAFVRDFVRRIGKL